MIYDIGLRDSPSGSEDPAEMQKFRNAEIQK